MTNPFLPQQPAAPAQQPQQAPNPFTQQQAPAAPAPQQYTQQPQQYGAPSVQGGTPWPQGATAGAPGLVARPGQFSTPPPPSASGSSNQPRISDLQGRLLIILPETIQRGLPSKFMGPNGQPQTIDRMTCTVIVLDGPIVWGQPGQQQQAQAPMVIKGLWIQQTKLIEQLNEALTLRQQGDPRGLALGRLWKAGTAANDPYMLAAAQAHEVAVYDQYVAANNPFAV